ncbi:MAG: hypothetical protein K2M31_01875 [Muribaculaceae bacterium]|nr:hypothetical protein [Muribaculaceae bacterium]
MEDLQIQYAGDSDDNVITLPGFAPTLDPNRPQLLHRCETFAIPQGYKVAGVSIQVQTCDTLSLRIAPSTYANLIQNDTITSKNIEIEPYEGIWPRKSISPGRTQIYRGSPIGRFNIYPVSYDYNKERVYYTRKFIANILFTQESGQFFRTGSNSSYSQDISHMLSIPETATTNNTLHNNGDISTLGIVLPPPTTPDYYYSPNYLIITPDFLKPAAERFAEWKSSIGYYVRIEEIEDCEFKSADDFKFLIEQIYYGDEPFEYVLLFGDGNLIKPHLGNHVFIQQGERMRYYTDYYMSCLDGDGDDLPDVYIGRFPVSTIEEANALVTKIINYEKNPPTDDRFYENTILYAEYDKEATVDASYFVEACHQIYTGLNNHTYFDKQYVAHDFYQALTDADPQYFYGYRPMPDYLKNYNWLRSPDTMIDEWNRGVYLVGVHSHGEVFGWANNGVREEHLAQLNNTSNIPILFSFSCYSGSFYHPNHLGYEESIGLQLLKKTNGGVASYIGANGYTWSPYNGYYFSGLYDAMYHGCIPSFKLGSYDSYLPMAYGLSYQLGKVMEIGRNRLSDAFEDVSYNHDYYEASKEVFHILGDPSLNVYHGKPLSLRPQFLKTSDGYTLKDPRKLVLRFKNKISSIYYPRNYEIPLAKLLEYSDNYDMCLVEDVPFQAYIPEFITKDQLMRLANGASIDKISVNGNQVKLEVTSLRSDLRAVSYDIYGNIIDSSNINENIGTINLSSGLNVVALEGEGQILDSKRIMITK